MSQQPWYPYYNRELGDQNAGSPVPRSGLYHPDSLLAHHSLVQLAQHIIVSLWYPVGERGCKPSREPSRERGWEPSREPSRERGWEPSREPSRERGWEPSREPGGKTRTAKAFTFFPSVAELYEYVQTFRWETRSFFELIPGNWPQKPHFDLELDAPVDATGHADLASLAVVEDTLQETITALRQVWSEVGRSLDLGDILLYSSHGPQKRSYHIVIGGVYHTDHLAAKGLYTVVKERLSVRCQPYLDVKVYSSNQQFRMLGSQKHGSGREKIWHRTWTYQGQEITCRRPGATPLAALTESLLSQIGGCTLLPPWQPANRPTHPVAFPDQELDPAVVVRALEKFAQSPLGGDAVYRNLSGPYICLRRIRPAFCQLCQRIHEKDHPYLRVIRGQVYWYCRRGPRLLLGEVDTVTNPGAITMDLGIGGQITVGTSPVAPPPVVPYRPAESSPRGTGSVIEPQWMARLTPIPASRPIEERAQSRVDVARDYSADTPTRRVASHRQTTIVEPPRINSGRTSNYEMLLNIGRTPSAGQIVPLLLPRAHSDWWKR
jgi:hypothetical protein